MLHDEERGEYVTLVGKLHVYSTIAATAFLIKLIFAALGVFYRIKVNHFNKMAHKENIDQHTNDRMMTCYDMT